MRAVVQRVSHAAVTVGQEMVGEIGNGLLVLLGVAADDSTDDVAYLAEKIAVLRIFEDDAGKMNRSVAEVGGAVLVVSQFTLLGDCRKGRRPSFTAAAAAGDAARRFYEAFVQHMKDRGLPVATGRFAESMQVALVNDGPVTLLLDSRRTF